MFNFSTIATAHGIETTELTAALNRAGWDFSAFDPNDAEATAFITATVTGYAERMATTKATVAARRAKAEACKPKKTALAVKFPELECTRCSGVGIINGFNHIEGGVCFACNQSGIRRVRRCS